MNSLKFAPLKKTAYNTAEALLYRKSGFKNIKRAADITGQFNAADAKSGKFLGSLSLNYDTPAFYMRSRSRTILGRIIPEKYANTGWITSNHITEADNLSAEEQKKFGNTVNNLLVKLSDKFKKPVFISSFDSKPVIANAMESKKYIAIPMEKGWHNNFREVRAIGGSELKDNLYFCKSKAVKSNVEKTYNTETYGEIDDYLNYHDIIALMHFKQAKSPEYFQPDVFKCIKDLYRSMCANIASLFRPL